jgi:hypothetical protein
MGRCTPETEDLTMNTQDVAAAIGTDAKTLRRFLRDPSSTFEAVGSGARYSFDEADIPVLRRKFVKWAETQKTSVPVTRAAHHNTPTPTHSRVARAFAERDRLVWDEEGEVKVPDIRNPRVLAEVRRAAADRAEALDRMLLEAGLHISQHRVG